MRHIPRFFSSHKLTIGAFLNLSPEQMYHATKVLRLKEGEIVKVFNSIDGEWECSIHSIKNCSVKVIKQLKNAQKEVGFSIACALINPNKFALMVEKVTELGVSSIIPIITDFTQYKTFNIKKLKQIIMQAVEQSCRLSIPSLSEPIGLKEFLNNFPSNEQLLIGLETNIPKKLTDNFQQQCTFLVGPEGGFSEKEMALFGEYNFISTFHFGNNILRSETAAIAFASSWILQYG